jgi:hypothetical protein
MVMSRIAVPDSETGLNLHATLKPGEEMLVIGFCSARRSFPRSMIRARPVAGDPANRTTGVRGEAANRTSWVARTGIFRATSITYPSLPPAIALAWARIVPSSSSYSGSSKPETAQVAPLPSTRKPVIWIAGGVPTTRKELQSTVA